MTDQTQSTPIDLTYGYFLLDGVIVDMDEEPVKLLDSCNCDEGVLCSRPECIDNQMQNEAWALCRKVPAQWVAYMDKRKALAK